jgi:hypothetical protein
MGEPEVSNESDGESASDGSPDEPSAPQRRWKSWGSRAGGRKTEEAPEITGKFYGKQGPHFHTSD